jgi:hypothetical protein
LGTIGCHCRLNGQRVFGGSFGGDPYLGEDEEDGEIRGMAWNRSPVLSGPSWDSTPRTAPCILLVGTFPRRGSVGDNGQRVFGGSFGGDPYLGEDEEDGEIRGMAWKGNGSSVASAIRSIVGQYATDCALHFAGRDFSPTGVSCLVEIRT